MARLAQLSQLDTERGRAALALLLETSPLMRFFEQNNAFEEGATDFLWRPVDPSATVQSRALGGEYTPDDATPASRIADSLKFQGDGFDVDESHKADARRGLDNIDRWIDAEFNRRIRDWAEKYEIHMMNADGTSNANNGFADILDGVTDLPGYTGETGVINAASWLAAAPDSFDLGNEDNWGTFIEQLTKLIQTVRGVDGILMSPDLYARMSTIAQVKHILGESRDLFGVTVDTFKRQPMIALVDGAITLTEPDDGGPAVNETTSLYIVGAGEQETSIVTNSGFEFDDEYDLELKESERVKWEMRTRIKIEGKKSIRRVRNIKL